MAWPTPGRHFQVRTDWKRVRVLALLRHAAGLILSPNGVLHRLLQASAAPHGRAGVTKSSQLLGTHPGYFALWHQGIQ